MVTGYLIFGTAIIKQFLGGNQPVDPPIVKLAFLAYYALIGLLMALRPAPLITGMKRNALFGMFLLLPLASVTWSIHPDATLARAVAVSGCSLFGLYVALYLPAPRALWLLALAGLIGAVISFMLIVALPSFGIAQGGPWAGT